MKVYVVFKMAKFECDVGGNHYNPKKGMVGIMDGNKCVSIKLLKCSEDFNPPLEKRINIFFDDYGKAVSYKTVD